MIIEWTVLYSSYLDLFQIELRPFVGHLWPAVPGRQPFPTGHLDSWRLLLNMEWLRRCYDAALFIVGQTNLLPVSGRIVTGWSRPPRKQLTCHRRRQHVNGRQFSLGGGGLAQAAGLSTAALTILAGRIRRRRHQQRGGWWRRQAFDWWRVERKSWSTQLLRRRVPSLRRRPWLWLFRLLDLRRRWGRWTAFFVDRVEWELGKSRETSNLTCRQLCLKGILNTYIEYTIKFKITYAFLNVVKLIVKCFVFSYEKRPLKMTC